MQIFSRLDNQNFVLLRSAYRKRSLKETTHLPVVYRRFMRSRAALSVFCIRQAIVMGPTPPGTGVM